MPGHPVLPDWTHLRRQEPACGAASWLPGRQARLVCQNTCRRGVSGAPVREGHLTRAVPQLPLVPDRVSHEVVTATEEVNECRVVGKIVPPIFALLAILEVQLYVAAILGKSRGARAKAGVPDVHRLLLVGHVQLGDAGEGVSVAQARHGRRQVPG
jgi:hypothetical protein